MFFFTHETNSSPLKMVVSNRNSPFPRVYFSVANCLSTCLQDDLKTPQDLSSDCGVFSSGRGGGDLKR